jgi:hypothetical protein
MKICKMVLVIVLFSLVGCNLLGDDTPKEKENRTINWGLRLQIGNYTLDSIFPPEGWSQNGFYSVDMREICIQEPNCRTVPRVGKLYGWDNDCFEHVEFYAPIGDMGQAAVDSVTGEFDFSHINLELQGGITYRIWPQNKYDLMPDLKCWLNPLGAIEVFFSFY